MKKIHLQREPNFEAILKAFPYQEKAFNAIKNFEYAAIFHEQGLGKTKIAIDLLLFWLEKTEIDTVLIVTKKQLVQNWMSEFKNHSHLTPAILTNKKEDNYYVFTGPSRAMVTNFETLQTEKERFKLYLNTRNVAIIIDESAKLKNPDSKLTQTFFELSRSFKKRVIMTGTPVANRPYDIWAQIYFLDFGLSLGKDFSEFKKSTNLSNNLNSDDAKRKTFEESVSSIFSKISTFSVRETKNSGVISLPDKVYICENAEFSKEQYALYKQIKNELIVEIEKDGVRLVDDSSATVKRLLRLVQVTSNPKLVDESFAGFSAKEYVLDSVLNKIFLRGEKCIVWSSFIENVEYFSKKYASIGSAKIHGRMKIEDRNHSVKKFKEAECKILFATPASAKEGLTLTMANHVIFYDRGFSLDEYLQAQDRIHRISQTKRCYIHNIIVRNSIDEWIDLLLSAKQKAANLAQGDMSFADYASIADYSYGEIIQGILFPKEEDTYE